MLGQASQHLAGHLGHSPTENVTPPDPEGMEAHFQDFANVLVLKGVGPSEELLVQKEKKYSLGTFCSGSHLHTIPYHTLMKIYKQNVHLDMEYCIQAWSLWLKQDIDLLENVQQRAIKAVTGLLDLYEEKIKTLKMQPLQDRCFRGDMIQTFKLLKGIDNIVSNKVFNLSVERHSYYAKQL